MRTGDFDYSLPPDLIAQTPMEPRDHSRLLVLDRQSGAMEHRRFYDLTDYLQAGDVLIFNDSRVIPARLNARKDTGAKLEVLLLQRLGRGRWQTLMRPARRAPVGTAIRIYGQREAIHALAEVVEVHEDGIRVLQFTDDSGLSALGEMALPPYIHTPLADSSRYQTVYSHDEGSVAAPTAGLHFTPELIDRARQKGVRCVFVTLHVGLDTFRPVREEDPLEHEIHQEFGIIDAEAATEIRQAKAEGHRVVCVGTTSVRLVEAAAQADVPEGTPFGKWVDLFIVPGHRFRVVDAMVTNFHLPRTTLLMLVSAFAGREQVLAAYKEAVAQRYRFYSFGDAMLII